MDKLNEIYDQYMMDISSDMIEQSIFEINNNNIFFHPESDQETLIITFNPTEYIGGIDSIILPQIDDDDQEKGHIPSDDYDQEINNMLQQANITGEEQEGKGHSPSLITKMTKSFIINPSSPNKNLMVTDIKEETTTGNDHTLENKTLLFYEIKSRSNTISTKYITFSPVDVGTLNCMQDRNMKIYYRFPFFSSRPNTKLKYVLQEFIISRNLLQNLNETIYKVKFYMARIISPDQIVRKYELIDLNQTIKQIGNINDDVNIFYRIYSVEKIQEFEEINSIKETLFPEISMEEDENNNFLGEQNSLSNSTIISLPVTTVTSLHMNIEPLNIINNKRKRLIDTQSNVKLEPEDTTDDDDESSVDTTSLTLVSPTSVPEIIEGIGRGTAPPVRRGTASLPAIIKGGAVPLQCSCKKSKCLKLYCECFRNNQSCTSKCHCKGCYNKEEQNAVIESKRQVAKQQRLLNDQLNQMSVVYNSSCTCKHSQCIRKYCVCYKKGNRCNLSCSCINCKNGGAAPLPTPL